MMNMMEIDGYRAIVKFDPEIEMFRGEFVGLNGSADFYARDVENLKREGAISLRVFLHACKERGIVPRKQYSGKFNVRIPAELHSGIVGAASAEGKSLNQWIHGVLEQAVQDETSRGDRS